MKQDFRRCGGVHCMNDRISIYIEGLVTSIRPMVTRYRKANRRASYFDVIQSAGEEGTACRERMRQASREAPMMRSKTLRRSQKVLVLDQYQSHEKGGRRVPIGTLRILCIPRRMKRGRKPYRWRKRKTKSHSWTRKDHRMIRRLFSQAGLSF